MFLSLDGTLFVQLVNFAIFFALLNVVFLRPVGRAIAKRREYINSLVSDYERIRRKRGACAPRPRRFAPSRGAKPSNASPRRGRKVRTRRRRSRRRYAAASQKHHGRRPKDARRPSSKQARAGESEAVRGLADVMLDRVIPGGGAVNDANSTSGSPSGARSFRRSYSSAVLVYMWFRWILPVVMAAQERSNRQIAEGERHRDEVKARTRLAAGGNRNRSARRAAHRRARERSRRTRAQALRAGGNGSRRAARSRCRTANSSAPAPRRGSGCATNCRERAAASRAKTPHAGSGRHSTRVLSSGSPVRWKARRMVNRTLARRYAVAIASLAREQNAVERVTADLQRSPAQSAHPGSMRDFFESPVVDRRAKERMLARSLRRKGSSDRTARAVAAGSQTARGLAAARSSTSILSLHVQARGVETLTLESARALDRAEYARLVAGLEARYRKKFEITEVVDPASDRRPAHHDGRPADRRLHLGAPRRSGTRALGSKLTRDES